MIQAKFAATQTVSIPVPQERISIQHYLRQPHRLIHALVEPSQAQKIAPDCYRLKMRSRQFMMLTLQPIVDIRIWADDKATLYLEAINCELGGLDFVNQKFNLSLQGVLTPTPQQTLEGSANLAVHVDLPPMLWMTPKSILNSAGNTMLKSILASVKHRLVLQIVEDYQQWSQTVSETYDLTPTSRGQILPELL